MDVRRAKNVALRTFFTTLQPYFITLRTDLDAIRHIYYVMRYTCCAALIAEFPGGEGEFFAGGRMLEGDAQSMQVQSMRWVAGGVARQSADTIAC